MQHKTEVNERTPHPKADILRAIADGKTVQMRSTKNYDDNEWWEPSDILQNINDGHHEFRIKPEFMTLSGHEFPAPMQEPLNEGQVYWTPRLHAYEEMCEADEWTGHKADLENLKRNIIHLTREGAIAQAKAMIAACGGEV